MTSKLNKDDKVMVRRTAGADVNGYLYKTVECRITRVFATCYEIEAINGEQVLPNKIARTQSDWWWEV